MATQFPQVTDAQVAFAATIPDFEQQLANARLAQEAGTVTREHKKLFNALFFQGGTIPQGAAMTAEERKQAMRYLRVVMSSFNPKHKHKELLSAYILSEIMA